MVSMDETVATGSADQKIKVWRKDSKGSGWELEAEWKASRVVRSRSELRSTRLIIRDEL
jgi:hypothetical protein